MKLNIDGETVSLNPDPTGGWCAIAEIDGERYIIHLTATRIGAQPAVTPSHARWAFPRELGPDRDDK